MIDIYSSEEEYFINNNYSIFNINSLYLDNNNKYINSNNEFNSIPLLGRNLKK